MSEEGVLPPEEAEEKKEQEETLRFLQEAGLGSTQIDPTSLEALRSLVTPTRGNSALKRPENERENDSTQLQQQVPVAAAAAVAATTMETTTDAPMQTTTTDSVSTDRAEANDDDDVVPPLTMLQPIGMRHVGSDLTQARSLSRGGTNDVATDATTAGDEYSKTMAQQQQHKATETEKRILDQLEAQTELLLELQRRVEELTNLVLVANQQQQPQQPQNLRGPVMATTPAVEARATTRNAPAAPARTTAAAPRAHIPAAAAANVVVPAEAAAAPRAAAAAPPPQDDNNNLPWTRLVEYLSNVSTSIQNSRFVKIWRVFWSLHRRQVGPIDGRLFLKLILVVALLAAKLSSSSSSHRGGRAQQGKQRSAFSSIQFQVAMVLIAIGFLVQTGYVGFCWRFFVKERYHERIWNGEEIDVEALPAAGAPRQNNRRGARARQEAAGFLGGGIPPVEQQQRNGGGGFVKVLLYDVLYLLGSFVLSIFPMWKPEGMQQQQQQQPGNDDGQPQAAEREGAEENNGDAGHNQE